MGRHLTYGIMGAIIVFFFSLGDLYSKYHNLGMSHEEVMNSALAESGIKALIAFVVLFLFNAGREALKTNK